MDIEYLFQLILDLQEIELPYPPGYYVIIFLVIFGLLYSFFTSKLKKHLFFRAIARWKLFRLHYINGNEKKIKFLRKVNPYVFEELILTALKKRGYIIKRNKRYTGDGGLDGEVTINNINYLIQAKRYSGYIDSSHVKKFAYLCNKYRKRGLFVHTGRAGKKSDEIANSNFQKISIIGDNRLLDMLQNKSKNKVTEK